MTSVIKEIAVGLQRAGPTLPTLLLVSIQGVDGAGLDPWILLGIRQDWSANTDALHRKRQNQLYFLYKAGVI